MPTWVNAGEVFLSLFRGKANDYYLSICLGEMASELYPSARLLSLSYTKTKSISGIHEPSNFNFVMGYTPGIRSFCKKEGSTMSLLVGDNFYKKLFKANSEEEEDLLVQQQDWSDIDTMVNESSHHCHLLVAGRQKCGELEAIACLSFVPNEKGSVISWFGVSDNIFNTSLYGIHGDNASFRTRGIGSFLVACLIRFNKEMGNETHLFLQMNPDEKDAVRFWRSRLLFRPWLSSVPSFLHKHLIDDEGLQLLHATHDSLLQIWPHEISMKTSLPSLFESARQVIFQEYPTKKSHIADTLYLKECLDLLTQFWRESLLPSLPSVTENFVLEQDESCIFADDAILEDLFLINDKKTVHWQSHVLEDIHETQTSFYTTIAFLLFGNTSIYYEMKVVLSHLFCLISRVPTKHNLWKDDKFLMRVHDYAQHLHEADLANHYVEVGLHSEGAVSPYQRVGQDSSFSSKSDHDLEFEDKHSVATA